MNKKILPLAIICLFPIALDAQENPPIAEDPEEVGAYLRVWCGLAPQQPPKEFGYRMPFNTPRRLLIKNPKGEETPLYNQITPFMVRGYNSVPAGEGQIELVEDISASDPTAGVRSLAGMPVRLQKSKYYTAAIWLEAGKVTLKVWEDLPAILPPPEPDAPAPPATRILRVFNLVPTTRAVVTSKDAGINLKSNDSVWPVKENIPAGNWKISVQGVTGKTQFQSESDLDYTQPANYSILLIGNSYNKTSVRVMPDATSPAE
jgi:hypothetical protein